MHVSVAHDRTERGIAAGMRIIKGHMIWVVPAVSVMMWVRGEREEKKLISRDSTGISMASRIGIRSLGGVCGHEAM